MLALGLMTAPAPQDADVEQAARLFEEGQLDEAAAQLRAVLESGTGDARAARLLLADVQVALGDAPAAIETLDALGSTDDHDVARALGGTYLAWADQLAMQGSPEDDVRTTLMDASNQLERASRLAPDGDLRALVQLGNLRLYRLGEHEQVIAMTDEALAANPDDGELLLLRGCAGVYRYWNAKQAGESGATRAQEAWAASVDDLQAAAKALPRGRNEPWGQLVWLYEDNGKPLDAVNAAITIVERDPDASFDTLYRLAVRYSFERNFVASGKALETMIGLSAREVTNRLRQEEDLDAVATELAWSIDPYVNGNDLATARTILSAIVAAEPTNAVIWDNYAVMCQQTARYEDAVAAYEHLLTFEYTDPRVYNDLGAVLQFDLERDLDRANELYQTCIDKAREELAAGEVEPARREHLQLAMSVAEDNLGGTDTRGGMLGGLMDVLGGLAQGASGGEAAGADDEPAEDAGEVTAGEPEAEDSASAEQPERD
jgi:tetratricopeptide (TPR) repeat protein